MSHILSSLEAASRALSLQLSPRSYLSSRVVSNFLFHHGCQQDHPYHHATRWQRLGVTSPLFHRRRRYSTTPKKISDPLHILFCGSDDFSCASLKALHDEHVKNPDLIRSIDVVVRPGKRTGRGYKVIRHPPIRSLAEELKLQIHERDTFTGWDMPPKTNLIIAVSFGLFVPQRLLKASKYGGLNLHPSLLPDLRGAAPLQHTLLQGRKLTGVSLQTLHHQTFDHGVVLAQTPSDPQEPGALLIPDSCTTVPDLQALVTPVATAMLVRGLREGLHVPPLEDRGWKPDGEEAGALLHAPKITKADRQVTSRLLRACDEGARGQGGGGEDPERNKKTNAPASFALARRQDAIGPLWFAARDPKGQAKRVIIEELRKLPAESLRQGVPQMLLEIEGPSARAEKSSSSGPSSTSLSSSPSSPPEDPYASLRSIPGIASEGRKYFLVPFVDEVGATAAADNHGPQDTSQSPSQPPPPPAKSKYLILWAEVGRSPYTDGPLRLGPYSIDRVKVEGYRATPTLPALRSFII